MSCIFCQPAESLLAEENQIFKAHLFPYAAVVIVVEHTVEIDLCSNLLGLLLTNLSRWQHDELIMLNWLFTKTVRLTYLGNNWADKQKVGNGLSSQATAYIKARCEETLKL